MIDAVGTTRYTYFAGGALLAEDGPWATDTVSYGYQNGLRVALTNQQPGGSWTNSSQDTAGVAWCVSVSLRSPKRRVRFAPSPHSKSFAMPGASGHASNPLPSVATDWDYAA